MKILAIYPGLNPSVNDIARALIFLVQQGHEVRVITARSNQSKSAQDQAIHQVIEGLDIFRPYARFFPDMIFTPAARLLPLQGMLDRFNPDVLLCSQEFTIRIGLAGRQMLDVDIPIVVVTEFAGDLADRGYPGLIANLTFPLVGLPRGKRFWTWLCAQSDAVITCYPGDANRLDALKCNDTSVHFVPWCNELPPDFQPATERDRGLAVYIGHFSPWKNTDAFLEIAPAVLDATPTRRILFVGSGKTRVIQALNKWGPRVEHIPGLPRAEALRVLSNAYYGITPTQRGGWGFIGDCWAVQTPVVGFSNDYQLHHKRDAMVASSVKEMTDGIQELYASSDLYCDLQRAGHNRYMQDHTAKAVGAAYETILLQAVDRKKRLTSGKIND